MEDRDVFILEEIVQYCDSIADVLNEYGGSYDKFAENSVFQDVCAFRAMQIGELMNSLSERFKLQHPEIPWRDVIAFRNIVAHDYGKVDVRRMWGTVTDDIPVVRDFCAKQIGM